MPSWAGGSVTRTPGRPDRRRLHRGPIELKDERTRRINRGKGLLANHGIGLAAVDAAFPETLAAARRRDGSELGPGPTGQLLREFARWRFVGRQVRDRAGERSKPIRRDDTPQVGQVRRLLELKGVGLGGAWLLVYELFGRRRINNRKELGSMVGLTPTAYQSGSTSHERGTSRAGDRRARRLLVELAWCWLRWQPDSELTRWHVRRFGVGPRARKAGIAALARKLLIALWRRLEHGELPAGARLCRWRPKVNGVPSIEMPGASDHVAQAPSQSNTCPSLPPEAMRRQRWSASTLVTIF